MIYIGSDHGGFDAKETIKQYLKELGYEVTDIGPNHLDPEDDYPLYSLQVAEAVSEEEDPEKAWVERPKGIVICRSSAGVVIAANKVIGIRAVSAFNETQAKHSREHNDANVLGLSGDWTEMPEMKAIIKTWVETEFSKEARHQRRIDEISEYEAENWGISGGCCGGNAGGGCCGGGHCSEGK